MERQRAELMDEWPVLPDGPTARGAGVRTLFNLSERNKLIGPPVGRKMMITASGRTGRTYAKMLLFL